MDTVKVEYTGPGKESDPRVITVTEEEAKTLIDSGLYRKKSGGKKSSSDQKEDNDG